MGRDFLVGCFGALLGALVLVVLLLGFAWYQQTLQVVQVVVPVDGLVPEWDGARIGLISDIHIGSRMSARRVRAVVRQLNAQKPDFVVIAGDTVDIRVKVASEAEPMLQPLQELGPPLGVYAVLGNHDSPSSHLWRPLLQRAGVRVLQNEHVRLLRDAAPLYLVGLADAFYGRLDAAAAWKGIPKGATVIAAVHEPDVADRLVGRPLSLQLSGHSHGGQVRLPFRKPRLLPPLGSKYPVGLQRADPGHLVYTTRGVGTSQIPFRLFARPEVTIITLRQG